MFMVGLYRGGRRYDVRFELMADFTQPPADPAARDEMLRAALKDYVARLEALCREAPYNWFNFHDFWNEEDTDALIPAARCCWLPAPGPGWHAPRPST
jgi:predicted LPLAT superfamily acyltransferase